MPAHGVHLVGNSRHARLDSSTARRPARAPGQVWLLCRASPSAGVGGLQFREGEDNGPRRLRTPHFVGVTASLGWSGVREGGGMGGVAPSARPTKNMVWVAGGDFAMGSEDFYPEERPVHTVGVDGFWMDELPVTVTEFRRFVKATGHVTVAETAPDPVEFPDADFDQLVPGSLGFAPPPRRVSLAPFR